MRTPLQDALAALGIGGAQARPVAGGDIHEAYRVDGPRTLFVKCNTRPLPGIFEREAEGLDALRAAGALAVPEVLGVGERWLALAWIERGAGGGEALGRGLAALHRQGSPKFGWATDNWIGSLPQPNAWQEDLAAFFAGRLRGLAGALDTAGRRRLDRLVERLDELLPPEPPALLHGDLWGGNWMADSAGVPWIFDPAVHFGCREAELAFTQLFGGFPPVFQAAYREAFPLEPGFEQRVDLWNLYPLLVHANLFGGGYAVSVDRIVRRYAP